jgi:hypothetical protein
MKDRISFLVRSLLWLAVTVPTMVLPLAAQSFEGSVSYAIRLSGKDAPALLVDEPPKKMDLHIKGPNYIVSLSGGRIARTMLFLSDSNETYIIDAANRRAFKNTYYLDTVKTSPTATATGEVVDVKGISCKEYLVEKPQTQEKIYYYVSDLYRVDPVLYLGKTDAKADFLTNGLDGRIPLRKVMKTPNLTTELDLIGVKAKTLEAENFQMPRGFVIKKRDPRI